jgi:SWI/SNF-related matrix-associated actin-dependent regulator 1 of chromatin subfamily A
MNYLKHDNNFIYFKAQAHEAAKLGAIYVGSMRAYKLPMNPYTLKDLQIHTISHNIEDLLGKQVAKHNFMRSLKERIAPKLGDLRPYQAVDVGILQNHPRLAIFNEQRTGKTPTILTALQNYERGMVVCPASLKLNWLKEAKRWAKTDYIVISGTKAKRKKLYETAGKANIIIGYETLRTDIIDILKIYKRFSFLVVDEAHRLRNHKTKQSVAVQKVGNISDRAYPMTGTPAVNHPSDVYGIFKLLNIHKYKSYWQFVERYFATYDTPFGRKLGGIRKERADEFNNLLYDNSLQRKRRDVMAWVPKVTHRTIEIEPTSKQNGLTREVVRKNTLLGNEIPNAITKLTRLRQICVDPMYFGVNTQSPKIKFILDYIEDNPEETVIIFSTMTGALHRLHSQIDGAMILTGRQTTEGKQFAVDQIQKGKSKVLLANIKAGGTGFTLDKADTIIFLDKSYTPDENEQAADRFIPVDPAATYGAKQVITLLVNGSVEPNIEVLLKRKINIISYVNDYGLKGILDL